MTAYNLTKGKVNIIESDIGRWVFANYDFLLPFDEKITPGGFATLIAEYYSIENPRNAAAVDLLVSLEG